MCWPLCDTSSHSRSAARRARLAASARSRQRVTRCLLHLLLGSIALRLAMGTRSQTADQSGALSTLAGSTLGWVALVVAVIGYALLAEGRPDEAARSWAAVPWLATPGRPGAPVRMMFAWP